ncbi:hypothetical protein SAMN05192574_10256 [Mucilaginibacter gossypiicola]|uniref:Uncharacterized protein n=1 Tax=Mucilaginibacter gossypiicola TaxID=551995 RepID=A0A1H8CRB2_9SPHI|nr:hypothetical protein [Mucilaginibacter gossypiicola]SEM97761.1 hypothetical protein SAMN05192574_10256 [Mucilaginibacter gossypiicola]
MPLDFYDINDIQLNEKLFEIEYADLEIAESVAFSFKKATGITIDPYGTTRIYAGHARVIILLIKEHLSNLKDDKQRVKKRLNELVARLESVKDGFIIVGD